MVVLFFHVWHGCKMYAGHVLVYDIGVCLYIPNNASMYRFTFTLQYVLCRYVKNIFISASHLWPRGREILRKDWSPVVYNILYVTSHICIYVRLGKLTTIFLTRRVELIWKHLS